MTAARLPSSGGGGRKRGTQLEQRKAVFGLTNLPQGRHSPVRLVNELEARPGDDVVRLGQDELREELLLATVTKSPKAVGNSPESTDSISPPPANHSTTDWPSEVLRMLRGEEMLDIRKAYRYAGRPGRLRMADGRRRANLRGGSAWPGGSWRWRGRPRAGAWSAGNGAPAVVLEGQSAGAGGGGPAPS